MTRVLITGVRGKTGAALANLFSTRDDVEVLGGSSDPSTVTTVGIQPTAFSWDDPDGWEAATDGVDAVYLVRPDRPDAPELAARLLAVTGPETRVVLLSEQDADAFVGDDWALRVERAVRDSGRPWTVLRPGWFMQVLNDARFYRESIAAGELPFPAGQARLAWIDARDIAAVAERALLDDVWSGVVLELSGPEALSLPETAQVLTDGLGHSVEHHEQRLDQALDGTEGFERWETETTYQRIQMGVFAVVTDTVEQITGRAPRSLREFVRDHASTFAAVAST